MREIEASEPGARFPELLRAIERGEIVAINRRGEAVAHLVPAHTHDQSAREAAVDSFLERRAGWEATGMSSEEILAARHEGHRA